MTPSLRSYDITAVSMLLRRLRPLAALRYCRPRLSDLGLSLGIPAEGSHSSTQEPETGSRRLYTGRVWHSNDPGF